MKRLYQLLFADANDDTVRAYPFVGLFSTAGAAFGAIIGWAAVVYFFLVTLVLLYLSVRELRRRS